MEIGAPKQVVDVYCPTQQVPDVKQRWGEDSGSLEKYQLFFRPTCAFSLLLGAATF